MRSVILLVLLVLLAGCAGQGNANQDTDGDHLPDDQETGGTTISIAYANGTSESRRVTSDPHHTDTDADGLTDLDELGFKTDPRDPDTDDDGLADGRGVTLDPAGERAAVWRSLGILETPAGSGHFLGEMDATTACTLKAAQGSSDLPFADALSDGDEIAGWNVTLRGLPFRVTSDPCAPDTDRDGLPDDAEQKAGTDPRSIDTDGDGAADGRDADPLWDLGILVENVTFSGNATAPRLSLLVGDEAASAMQGGSATLAVNDTTPDRASLPLVMVLSARDQGNGHDIDVMGDVRGTYLQIDLVGGTTGVLQGVPQRTRHVSLQGADGTLSFDWRPARS